MSLVTFENDPSTNTPLNASNLNNNFEELEGYALLSESLTLLTSGWTLNSGTNLYEYEVTNASVTANHKVDIYMDIDNQAKFTGTAYTQTFAGSYKIYTDELPAEAISCTAYIELVKVGA